MQYVYYFKNMYIYIYMYIYKYLDQPNPTLEISRVPKITEVFRKEPGPSLFSIFTYCPTLWVRTSCHTTAEFVLMLFVFF